MAPSRNRPVASQNRFALTPNKFSATITAESQTAAPETSSTEVSVTPSVRDTNTHGSSSLSKPRTPPVAPKNRYILTPNKFTARVEEPEQTTPEASSTPTGEDDRMYDSSTLSRPRVKPITPVDRFRLTPSKFTTGVNNRDQTASRATSVKAGVAEDSRRASKSDCSIEQASHVPPVAPQRSSNTEVSLSQYLRDASRRDASNPESSPVPPAAPSERFTLTPRKSEKKNGSTAGKPRSESRIDLTGRTTARDVQHINPNTSPIQSRRSVPPVAPGRRFSLTPRTSDCHKATSGASVARNVSMPNAQRPGLTAQSPLPSIPPVAPVDRFTLTPRRSTHNAAKNSNAPGTETSILPSYTTSNSPSSGPVKHEKWTDAEVTMLRYLRKANRGWTWETVAQHMPGRSEAACRGKFHS